MLAVLVVHAGCGTGGAVRRRLRRPPSAREPYPSRGLCRYLVALATCPRAFALTVERRQEGVDDLGVELG